MKKTILLIEDDASGRQVLDFRLQQAGYQVITAVDGQQGYQLFTEHFPDLVITDMAMPAMNGLELTQQIKLIAPDIPIIVVTAFGDVQTAVTAIKSGAADYLTKPLNWEELKVIIERCLNLQELLHENRRLQALVTERFQFDNIIGSAKSMQAIYNLLARVARTDVTVLLLGESGTGKELVAKSLHHHSLRSRFQSNFWSQNYLAIAKVHLPAQFMTNAGYLKKLNTVQFFWMKLANCHLNYKLNY
jgi:two-component system NtrC family response regulator